MFNLKTQPWHIHVNSPEESEAAQKWLFSQGVFWCNGDTKVDCKNNILLANYYYTDSVENAEVNKSGFMHCSYSSEYSISELELKLTFAQHLSVESYAPPAGESPQQKQIRELQETIAKAQEQIESLKKVI